VDEYLGIESEKKHVCAVGRCSSGFAKDLTGGAIRRKFIGKSLVNTTRIV
jgi:hypothetical protein